MLAGLLPACAFIIPEDPNMPRNNKVEGEVRQPILNTNGGAPQSFNRLQSAPTQERMIDVPPVATSDQSVDASALANMRPAAGSDTRPVVMNPVRTVVVQPSAASQSLPPAVITPNPALQDNAAYQVGAAGYPSLHAVPERPVTEGDASSQEQLRRARAALEADRVEALESKVRLDADAAAEPSLLNEMPSVAPAPAANPQPMAPQSAIRPPTPAQQAANMAPAAGGNPAAPIGITLAAVDMRAPYLPASPVFAPPAPLASRNPAPVAATAAPVYVQPTPQAPVAALAPQPVPAAGGIPVHFRTSAPVPAAAMPPQPVAAAMPVQPTPEPLPTYAAAPVVDPQPQMAALGHIPEIPPQVQQQPMSGRVAPISNGGAVAETFSPLITQKPAKQPLQLHKISGKFNPVAPFGTQRSNARTVARYSAPAMRSVPASPAPVQAVAALPSAAIQPVGAEQPNVTVGDFNPLAPVPAPAVSAQAAATMAPAAQAPVAAPAIRRGDFDPMASYNPAVARPAVGYTASSRYSEQR